MPFPSALYAQSIKCAGSSDRAKDPLLRAHSFSNRLLRVPAAQSDATAAESLIRRKTKNPPYCHAVPHADLTLC